MFKIILGILLAPVIILLAIISVLLVMSGTAVIACFDWVSGIICIALLIVFVKKVILKK